MIPNREGVHLIHEQRARALREEARVERLNAGRPRHSVRRAVGRSLVRIGVRLAQEPVQQPARST